MKTSGICDTLRAAWVIRLAIDSITLDGLNTDYLLFMSLNLDAWT
jgi:hypothetical protein